MSFSVVSLAQKQGMDDLEARLRKDQNNPHIVPKLMQRLGDLGAASVIFEENYLDRDFSEAFSAYYSRLFRRHSKLCQRLLFFSEDVSFLSAEKDIQLSADRLEGLAEHFLGWIVLRPIAGAPIGQIILKAPPSPTGFEGHLLVRASYTAHILGAELSVDAIPMTQQDSRIGSCAQASIWVSSRHFHAKHRGPWLSTVAITQAATQVSDYDINSSLPAGSEFLTINNIVSAFRAAGREALVYMSDGSGNQGYTWGAVDPAAVINRYVDSGIPVFVGLGSPNQGIGHAVIASGHIIREQSVNPLPNQPTRAAFCEAFYVNDDQIGSTVAMPIEPNSPIGQTWYSVRENVQFLIVPLPAKVFIPAESAEVLAWGALANYSNTWNSVKSRFPGKFGTSEAMGDAFVDDIRNNRVIARTYLTYGWKYARRMMRNRVPNQLKAILQSLELPKYVYVTEFGNISDNAHLLKTSRRVQAHAVVDATAKHQNLDAMLLFQAPGYCMWHQYENATFRRWAKPLVDCEPYFPKIRGKFDSADFTAAEQQAGGQQ